MDDVTFEEYQIMNHLEVVVEEVIVGDPNLDA